MGFLHFLEGLRVEPLNVIFSLITLFGEETLFMIVGMIIFWCINKYQGYYLLCVGFLGTVINQFLKMLCRIPRPWVKDPSFTIVESAREGASGYSFPSGHTQCSIGLYGGIARANKQKAARITGIVLCVLVPFSRMYLGVHTPYDVFTSVAIAIILIFALYPLFLKVENSPKTMYVILSVLTVITALYLMFVCLYDFPDSVYLEENVANLISAQKNGFTLLGSILGLFVVYTVDIKWVHFETKAPLWIQIIKVVLGISIVVLLKELLKAPLDFIFKGSMIARSVRYFIMVVVGGILYPMSFKYLNKLSKKSK